MSVRIKRTVIILMISLITLPFVLVTDLFPFMRFGMFAEPVRHQVQKETFEIFVLTKSGSKRVLKPDEIGIDDHFYQYLIRNYFYRSEGELLLDKIETMISPTPVQIELKRYPSKGQKEDTTITKRTR